MELPPNGKNIGFNLLDDEDLTIPYVVDTILYLPAFYQLTTHANKNMWFMDINSEEPMISQGAIDELQRHHNQRVKFKFKASLYISKIYQRKNLKYIQSRFDQFRPVVSHLKFFPHRYLQPQRTLSNLLKVLRVSYRKKLYFCNITRTKMSALFRLPYQSKTSLMEKSDFSGRVIPF